MLVEMSVFNSGLGRMETEGTRAPWLPHRSAASYHAAQLTSFKYIPCGMMLEEGGGEGSVDLAMAQCRRAAHGPAFKAMLPR
jgi:hypothetical protein